MMENYVPKDLTLKSIYFFFWLSSLQKQKTNTPVTNALVRFPVEVGGEGVR